MLASDVETFQQLLLLNVSIIYQETSLLFIGKVFPLILFLFL
jgi:hypothetical protein